MQDANEIRFDGWTLRRDSGELRRDGKLVRLRGQSQCVLEALLARPGEVVTRETLIARLWPKGIVDFETSLNSAVRRLRAELGDDAETPRYIETLPRRGYRFIGVTERDDARARSVATNSRPRRKSAASLVAAAALAIACAASTRVAHDTAHPPAKTSADAAARDAYGLARFFLQRSDAGDLERARDEFEKAIAADHSFADAYAGLASTYWRMTIRGDLPRDRGAALLRAAAERALALAPDLAEAHLRLANYAAIVPDGDRFGTHEALARQAEPGNALVLAVDSSDALADGRLDEGVALARRAAAAEPLSSVYRYNLAAALFLAGRFEEAKQVNLAEVNIDPHALTDVAAEVLILDERFDEALALAAAWPDGAARDETEALAYYGLHRTDAADAALARLIEDARDSDPLRIVEVYAYRGETDRALGWLAIGADWYRRGIQPCPGSCLVPWSLRLSPFTASLHDDARWRSWAANVGES